MIKLRTSAPCLMLIVGLIISNAALAQAFCALRDPITSIYGFFPEADSHRSIVKVVGNSTRTAIGERLPMELHFNELGKHTVYAAMNKGKPVGIVHARSEGDLWGLTEIVWALDLDLRVVDFSFQRCRHPARRELEESQFAQHIQGKSFDELRKLLTTDGTQLRSEEPVAPATAVNLALTVIRSGLKTIVVTDSVWGDELRLLRQQQLLHQHFDTPVMLSEIAAPYLPTAISDVATQLSAEETGIVREQLTMRRVHDRQNNTLGYYFSGPWQSGPTRTHLQWILTRDGEVLDVATQNTEVDAVVRNSTRQLIGFKALDAASCANALELGAFELGLLARQHNPD